MKVLTIGGSRNIGYYSSLRLLAAGATVTFLLRTPSVFDDDAAIQEYVKSGHARLVQGDGLVQADVQRAWDEATKGADGGVDLLLFTLGFTGSPAFRPLKGFVIKPANLVTQALLTALCTMPPTAPAQRPPRVIVLSSAGVTRTSHGALPAVYRPLYRWFLGPAHRDKAGAERVIAHVAGRAWVDGEPGEDIMGAEWQSRPGLPAAGALAGQAMVVRPALLTNGECRAEGGKGEGAYRAAGSVPGAYTVSRKDVAYFIVEGLLKRWEEYEGVVEIGY